MVLTPFTARHAAYRTRPTYRRGGFALNIDKPAPRLVIHTKDAFMPHRSDDAMLLERAPRNGLTITRASRVLSTSPTGAALLVQHAVLLSVGTKR